MALTAVLLRSTPLRLRVTKRPSFPPYINKSFPISSKLNSEQPILGIHVSNCSSPENKQSSNQHHHHQDGFCALESDEVPWEIGSVWTTMAFYLFSLHIPMSFGGLSIVAQVLNQPNLGPEIKASSSSPMDWRVALVVSSAAFSASHLSAENSLQLFVIGLVLGSSYCWTGNLASSIALHSMYNAFTLVVTLLAAA